MKKITFDRSLNGIFGALVVAFALFFATGATFAGDDYVYVDDDASGTMDGSSEHPFLSIQDAINLAEDRDKKVFVRNGYYRESFEIWDDIEVHGEDRNRVIVNGKNDDPVVTMYDDTEISEMTLKDGYYGVRIKKGAHAVISECSIVDNDSDGIKAKSADLDDDEQLEVYDSYIARNGGSGLYSESRKIVFENNLVEENEKDGIDLDFDVEGYIHGNKFKKNEGVGGKFRVDGSDIYVKNNTFYDNSGDGAEIDAYGRNGLINFKGNKFYKNEGWAVAKVEKYYFSYGSWQTNFLMTDSVFWENERGNISNVFKVY